MARHSLLTAALAALTAGAAATALPADVDAREGGAVAELAAPATVAETIAGGVLWRCEGTTCVAATPRERPLRACRELAREVGQVTGFAVGGKALEEDKIARCNG